MSKSIDQEPSMTDPNAWNDPGAEEHVSGMTLVLSANADRNYVESWLKQKGLEVVPMMQGFNILGKNATLRSLFGQGGTANPEPPPDLQPHVETILASQRKYIHER